MPWRHRFDRQSTPDVVSTQPFRPLTSPLLASPGLKDCLTAGVFAELPLPVMRDEAAGQCATDGQEIE